MKLAEALTLLREFPDKVLIDYAKEGDYDVEALFLSSKTGKDLTDLKQERLAKLFRLGFGELSEEEAVKSLKDRIYDYLTELSAISEYLSEEEDEEAEDCGKTIEFKQPSDYRIIIKTITRLAKIGNFNLDQISLMDAHFIIEAHDLPDSKTYEELYNEVMEKINVENEVVRLRRQQIWDSCSEEDRKNPQFLKHFLDSKDI